MLVPGSSLWIRTGLELLVAVEAGMRLGRLGHNSLRRLHRHRQLPLPLLHLSLLGWLLDNVLEKQQMLY